MYAEILRYQADRLVICVCYQKYTAAGYDKLPICMAKTQYSLSTDAAAKVNYPPPILTILFLL